MNIRRAQEKDIPGLNRLLLQVLRVHHAGRPDLFKPEARKYNDDQLRVMVHDDTRPIFVALDENENVLGYCFCVHVQHLNDNVLTDIRTLYIDDLCVDEKCRHQHIGQKLYAHVLEYAKSHNYYNITLNVWELNDSAKTFYEKLGLKPQKHGLEMILE